MIEETEDTEETQDEASASASAEPEAPAETPSAEAAGDAAEADAPAEPEADVEPEEVLTPRERKRKERRTHTGEANPSRGIEERTAARLAKRKKNADERRRYRGKSREKRRTGGEGTPPADRAGTGSPRVLRGIVVSDKSDKTITVRIDLARQHRTYGKIVRTSSKVAAHDERNEANAGDTVRVVESRPLSKSKRWRLIEVVERAR